MDTDTLRWYRVGKKRHTDYAALVFANSLCSSLALCSPAADVRVGIAWNLCARSKQDTLRATVRGAMARARRSCLTVE